MEHEQLKQELSELHQQLDEVANSHTALDAATLESLRRVASDIEAILHEQSREPTDDDQDPEAREPIETAHLPSTLEELAEEFSVEYPQTAAMLNRIGYLLGNMGI